MPAELRSCIAATQVDILASPLRSHCPNLSGEERHGLEEVQKLQKSGEIVIKRSDKAGGWVIVDTQVYVKEGDKKLDEKYRAEDGTEQAKYKVVDEKVLKKQHKALKEMAREGLEKKYISMEDSLNMVPPEPRAGRLYMNSKGS